MGAGAASSDVARCMVKAAGSRPAARTRSRIAWTAAAARSRGMTPDEIQPSPSRAARSSARGAVPPTRIGGPPGLTGFGSMLICSTR